jgi:hypothetical protein
MAINTEQTKLLMDEDTILCILIMASVTPSQIRAVTSEIVDVRIRKKAEGGI